MSQTNPQPPRAFRPELNPILSAALWAVTGILLFLYPLLRPFSSETGQAGAEAFTNPLWLWSHGFAMLAFTLIAFLLFRRDQAKTQNRLAATLTLLAVACLLPYYGAESYGLTAAGEYSISSTNFEALAPLAELTRYGSGVYFFVAGFLIWIAASLFFALAQRKTSTINQLGSWLFFAGVLTFLPQFFFSAEIRIGHGALIALGCLLIAVSEFRGPRLKLEQG